MTLSAETKTDICRLFVRAAKLIETGETVCGSNPRRDGCCYAIFLASIRFPAPNAQPAHYVLKHIFAPNSRRMYYLGPRGKNMDFRILALLFAAEFVESGDADDL